jgi:cytochrome b6-f complex iron-sulfur subunit
MRCGIHIDGAEAVCDDTKRSVLVEDMQESSRPSDISPAAERDGVGHPSAATGSVSNESGRVEAPSPGQRIDVGHRSPQDLRRSWRRRFMSSLLGSLVSSPMAVGFGALVVTQLLWFLGMFRFMFPNILQERPLRFLAGFPDALQRGQVDTRFVARHGAWIVRHEYEGRPQVFALKAVCTHLGCIPVWLENEQKFRCPCHGSGFHKDGVHFEGPAPRPLERFAIRVTEGGQLEVDRGRTFRQELGQWRDPASFVSA